jgi:hypothetical protein
MIFMEVKVIKRFRDKETNEVYPVGALYQSDNENRIKFLQGRGHLDMYNSDSNEGNSLLNQTVDEIKEAVTSDLGKEQLEQLLKEEHDGKGRKGVIEHIDSLLKES